MPSDIEDQVPGEENEGVSNKCHLLLLRYIFYICYVGVGGVFIFSAFVPVRRFTMLEGLPASLVMCVLALPIKFIRRTLSRPPTKGMAAIYHQPRRKDTIFNVAITTFSVLLARVGLLNAVLDSFGLHYLQKPILVCSELAFIITSNYFGAMLFVSFPAPILIMLKYNPYLYFGLFHSMTMVVYLSLVLGRWQLYFYATFEELILNQHVSYFVTWTLVSLFVGSIFWFLKTLLLLKWRANVIYHRFEPRILITGVKFLYLRVITAKLFERRILNKLKLLEEYARHQEPKNFNFTNYIMSKHLSSSYLEDVGQLLATLAETVRPMQEDGVPELLKFFEVDHRMHETVQECQPDDLMKLLECRELKVASKKLKLSHEEYSKKVANVLHCIVREQCASVADNQHNFSFEDFKKWMVDAHMNCVNMGRTLADANAIETRLDMFISVLIVVIVVILWLLIAKIATPTILATIATPLVALAFIFGDSPKAFFQGIIFCFGTHAFDVGDRCILDDTEMEVKSMGILTTTFTKIGTEEKRMYPNSLLATKAIVNGGWQPNPSDTVELPLNLSTSPIAWQLLERKIEEFFNDPQLKGFFQSSHEVTMKEVGDMVKITIRFKHVLNVKEMTHEQCFHKKERQRSIILKRVSCFLDPESPTMNGEQNGELVALPSNTSDIMKHSVIEIED